MWYVLLNERAATTMMAENTHPFQKMGLNKL
jgi:hypothetical protein